MRAITIDALPSPKGHYAHCIEHNGLLFISGQLPVDERGLIPDGIDAQAALLLRKLDGFCWRLAARAIACCGCAYTSLISHSGTS